MARNLTLLPLRGVQANLSQALPLALGEMYFATDTGNLYFGTPSYGLGYVQIGDTTKVNESILQLIEEIKAMRAAVVFMACDGGRAKPSDFDPRTDTGTDSSTTQD